MTGLVFRTATPSDLPTMIAMIADDQLGQGRENSSLPLDQRYLDDFAAIECDPNQMLVVVEQAGAVIGCMQITFIPGISRRGAWLARLNPSGSPVQGAVVGSGRRCSNGGSRSAGGAAAAWSSFSPTRAARVRTASMSGSASRPATRA